MQKPVKIALAISGLTFAVATLAVASVTGTVRNSASVQGSSLTIENGKLYPMAKTSQRGVPAMLLPNALDKAAADALKRRATDTARRKAALDTMQMGVIRLR